MIHRMTLARELLLPHHHRLGAADVAALVTAGVFRVEVLRRPRVAILATGDEVVPPQQEAGPGQIRDINSYTVAGQVRQAGGIPLLGGIVSDDLDALNNAARDALAEADMLVKSTGSSVTLRDMTVQVIERKG